jgi:hypothetical protein
MDPSPCVRPQPSRHSTPAAAAFFALLLAAHGPAAAQQPVTAFDQLASRLMAGDTVVVVDTAGTEHEGRLVSLSPSSIVISTRRDRPFAADQVRSVTKRGPHPLGKGLFWGVAAGAGAGVAWALVNTDGAGSAAGPPCPPGPGGMCPMPLPVSSATGNWNSVPIGMGAGALVGLFVGAIIPGRASVVYTAPQAGHRGGPRFTIAPFLTRRVRGASILVSF